MESKRMQEFVTFIIGVIVTFWLCSLGGCTPVRFQNVSSKNTFDQDKFDCSVLMGYAGHAGGNQPTDQLLNYAVRGQSDMRSCLERKGWKAVEEAS